MNVGRNEPCSCGSGLKFKKCCGSPTKALRVPSRINLQQDPTLALARSDAVERQRIRQQGLGKPIITAQSGGKRSVAIGTRILTGQWKTFHDFLFSYVIAAFGRAWWEDELRKSESLRHPFVTQHELAVASLGSLPVGPVGVKVGPMTGRIAAVLDLSYALYLLEHHGQTQPLLLNRLKHPDQFLGVSYEALVCGMLVRAGFEIQFEDETDSSQGHCELVATFKATGRRFSVEAKCREQGREHLRIRNQLRNALAKPAEYDRVIFLELNAICEVAVDPLQELDSLRTGIRECENQLTIDGKPTPEAYLVITNRPHWAYEDRDFSFWALLEGYKIRDLRLDSRFSSVREMVDASKKHGEVFALADSIRAHSTIPSTFDGEIPEFAFDAMPQRLLIGQAYPIPNENGQDVVGVLMHVVVPERESRAICAFQIPGGKTQLIECPLTKQEVQAYRQHPDTFFGVFQPVSKPLTDPLGLYEFFRNSKRDASRGQLISDLTGIRGRDSLDRLSSEELLDLYAEAMANTIIAQSGQGSAIAQQSDEAKTPL
jgi:hypothetical protein